MFVNKIKEYLVLNNKKMTSEFHMLLFLHKLLSIKIRKINSEKISN